MEIKKSRVTTKTIKMSSNTSKVVVQDFNFGGNKAGTIRCSKHDWVSTDKDGVRIRKFDPTDYKNRDDFKYFEMKYLAENSTRVRQCDECKIPFFKSRPEASGYVKIVRKNKITGTFEEVEKVTGVDGEGKPIKAVWKDLDDDCDYYKTCLKKHPYVRKWNEAMGRLDLVNEKVAKEQDWMKELNDSNRNHPQEGTIQMVPHTVYVCECSAAEDASCSVGYCNPCFMAKTNSTQPGTLELQHGVARRNRPSRG